MFKSLKRWIGFSLSTCKAMRVSQAGDRPSWPGGRTERSQAILQSLLLARRVVGHVQNEILCLSLIHHPVCSANEASRYFFGRSQPSWPGGQIACPHTSIAPAILIWTVLPSQEGWLCHQENIAKPPQSAQTGWWFNHQNKEFIV